VARPGVFHLGPAGRGHAALVADQCGHGLVEVLRREQATDPPVDQLDHLVLTQVDRGRMIRERRGAEHIVRVVHR
jgi:hypothetical protein